jgi:hypothetical protein
MIEDLGTPPEKVGYKAGLIVRVLSFLRLENQLLTITSLSLFLLFFPPSLGKRICIRAVLYSDLVGSLVRQDRPETCPLQRPAGRRTICRPVWLCEEFLVDAVCSRSRGGTVGKSGW